jgi:hypothetical protein
MVTKKLFLASSSDLLEDRKAVDLFIHHKNKHWAAEGIFLELAAWKRCFDEVSKVQLQDQYSQALCECDIFVSLFWTRIGQYTEEEFEIAFGQFRPANKPFIFTYFKDAPISVGSADWKNLKSLRAFQEKLDALGHFHSRYQNLDALKFHFNRHLDGLAANGFNEFEHDLAEPSQGSGHAAFSDALAQELSAQAAESSAFSRSGTANTSLDADARSAAGKGSNPRKT